MNLEEKLSILARAAKYDVSCSSSGSTRENNKKGFGNAKQSGICHSWTEDGRCVSLLKILLTNVCIYDCLYCENSSSNDIERAIFTPTEVASLTESFYRRNYIEGLFLSSAIIKNEDYTMELLTSTVKKLREDHSFNGYIHMKAIPGADAKLLSEAGKHVDRMSLNIELPSRNSLRLLAPEKDGDKIISSMKKVHHGINQAKDDKKKFKSAPSFVPAGQSTQLIVGATNDSDHDILKLSSNLYKKIGLKRVYYSAFIPVNNKHKDNLPALISPPYLREHRLYQADWLLRYYNFDYNELFVHDKENLSLDLDPKAHFALNNLHLFPVEINKASKGMLLKVPGIGPKSAAKIIKARKHHSLSLDDLKRMKIVLKRARYFITCGGKYPPRIPFKKDVIKSRLVNDFGYKQISIWESGLMS